MKTRQAALALLGPIALSINAAVAAGPAAAKQAVNTPLSGDVGACNDCHTPNYPETAGKVPESQWLAGHSTGFQGPWGTTYPANLRLVVQAMTEEQWVARVRAPMRPPMPWFNLRDMNDADLRALYRYIRSLGPKGEPAPAYVQPGGTVKTPYYVFVPQNPPPVQASAQAR
jgi:mono/diheme cytochrome c family protein